MTGMYLGRLFSPAAVGSLPPFPSISSIPSKPLRKPLCHWSDTPPVRWCPLCSQVPPAVPAGRGTLGGCTPRAIKPRARAGTDCG